MIIKEFLPNPIGNDKEGEYIKILNNGDNAVYLNGWKIRDASGKEFVLSGDLGAGEELALPYAQTKIFLNNNGEEISLFNSTGELVDSLNYSGTAEEGQVIERLATSEFATNGFENSGLINGQINNPIINYQFSITNVLVAAILAGLGVYIIKELEKRLEIKLW